MEPINSIITSPVIRSSWTSSRKGWAFKRSGNYVANALDRSCILLLAPESSDNETPNIASGGSVAWLLLTSLSPINLFDVGGIERCYLNASGVPSTFDGPLHDQFPHCQCDGTVPSGHQRSLTSRGKWWSNGDEARVNIIAMIEPFAGGYDTVRLLRPNRDRLYDKIESNWRYGNASSFSSFWSSSQDSWMVRNSPVCKIINSNNWFYWFRVQHNWHQVIGSFLRIDCNLSTGLN